MHAPEVMAHPGMQTRGFLPATLVAVPPAALAEERMMDTSRFMKGA